MKGRIFSEEHKASLKEALAKRTWTDEEKLALVERLNTPEVKEKRSKATKGLKRTPEQVQRLKEIGSKSDKEAFQSRMNSPEVVVKRQIAFEKMKAETEAKALIKKQEKERVRLTKKTERDAAKLVKQEQAKIAKENRVPYVYTEEHKRNIGIASKGHEVTEATRQKMSESAKGRVISEAQRQQISATLKSKNPKVYQRTEAQRATLRESHTKSQAMQAHVNGARDAKGHFIKRNAS